MKKINLITLLVLFSMENTLLQAQGISNFTKYYDYFSNPQLLYANDVAEDIITDGGNNIYVAGEERKDTPSQAMHLIKYDGNGAVLTQGTYNDVNYKEYVKKIIYDGSSYLYVVCNAVHITTGEQSLLVLKYSATNFVTPLSADYFYGYLNPADAVIAGSGSTGKLFISCQVQNRNTVSLSVLRLTKSTLTSNLFIQYSYTYDFPDTLNQSVETPRDILYSQTDQAVYVAGGVLEPVSGKTASLLIRLGTNLAAVYVKTGTLDVGKNTYNSVAINSSYVYVAGSFRNNPNNKHSWSVVRLEKATGVTLSSRSFNPGTTYYSEALKITLASTSAILVAGYSKDSVTGVYNAQIGKYAIDLSGGATYYGSSLPYNSNLVDAVSHSSGTTYLTGRMANGSKQNMFLLGYYALSGGSNFYRDSIVNNNACGNKIALFNSGTSNLFAVAGHQDKTSNNLQPHDYKMFTRIYLPQILRIAEPTVQSTVSVFPNPVSDYINITCASGIVSYRLFDLQGRIISEGSPSDITNTLQLPLAHLSNGVYFISINDEKAKQIIKQ